MKTLVLSAMMCLVAMTTTAQVITSEIVNNAYLSVATASDSKFAYNVECDDNDCITTMNVFNKTVLQNGDIELQPSCRYEYDYASDGIGSVQITYYFSAVIQTVYRILHQ